MRIRLGERLDIHEFYTKAMIKELEGADQKIRDDVDFLIRAFNSLLADLGYHEVVPWDQPIKLKKI